ncbi:hypothetical protein K504DRAFT_247381 [Pleomassaria siparia CBS 279.74]|uniref:Uncharacterized protein n=1 Tax=Pleomassaria siparia CBS 279.74 TaxID=1314801 RepID=A0A6G1KAS8_9PLEO|nr:hypothetical protein K504DRAFT_247381 [Pleomassaria siparia CBS 279.74]
MLSQYIIVALAATVAAVPLNINLGAYSPALVVGDGEISLGNAGAASELMATLATGATATGGAAEGKPAERRAAKRSVNLSQRNEDHLTAVTEAMAWIKRDLASFNAALGYAREAMKDAPKIEMGSEAAGVGIVVNAGVNVPTASAANGAKPPAGAAAGGKKEKRAEVVEESEAPKMTLVAITEV